MHRTLPVLCCLIAGSTSAQVLTTSNTPVPSAQYTYVKCTAYPVLDNYGIGYTWDLSDYTGTSTTLGIVALPASPDPDSFPAADAALVASGIYKYLEADADGYSLVGQHDLVNDAFVRFTDPHRLMVFPMTVEDGWMDDYAGEAMAITAHCDVNGHEDVFATASGTLELPWGTLQDILRVDRSDSTTQSGCGPNMVHTVRRLSEFHHPGVPVPIATLSHVRIYVGTQLYQSDSGLTYLSEDPTGLFERADRAEARIWPNPASEQVQCVLPADGAASWTLMDAAGRVVRTGRRSSAPGSLLTIGVAELPPGAYLLQCTMANGARISGRVVVRR